MSTIHFADTTSGSIQLVDGAESSRTDNRISSPRSSPSALTQDRSIDGNGTRLRLIAGLRDLPLVESFTVRVRQTQSGKRVLVAYIVPTAPMTSVDLTHRISSEMPALDADCVCVAVSQLPYTSTGIIDEVRLSSIPIVTEERIASWTEQLQRACNLPRVALVESNELVRPPAIHLFDIVSTLGSELSVPSEAEVPLSEPARPSGPVLKASSAPAIVRGPVLTQSRSYLSTLVDALQRAAESFPDVSILHIAADGSKFEQSFAALLREAQRICSGLRTHGAKVGDRVTLVLQNSRDIIPAFWACVWGGFVPVPAPEPTNYSARDGAFARLSGVLQLLEDPWVVTSVLCANSLRATSLVATGSPRVLEIDELRKYAPDALAAHRQPDELALVFLTSGSTGLPKGVMHSERTLLAFVTAQAEFNSFTAQDVTLNCMPLDHVGGLVMLHLRDVCLGAREINLATSRFLEMPSTWLAVASEQQATNCWLPNFAFALLNEAIRRSAPANWDLTAMRFILNGGEPIVADTALRFLRLLESHGLRAEAMKPSWGMAETSSGVTYSSTFFNTKENDAFVNLGMPVPETSLRVVDDEGQLVTQGTAGNLEIQGPTVFLGYYNNAVVTRQSFTADGWFRTGDLAYLSSAGLTLVGRAKNEIIINGMNYASHEIEAAVESVPGVSPSYVAAVAVRPRGAQTDALAIFLHYQGAMGATLLRDVRRSVRERIGLVPKFVLPVDREEIPKTSIGKIQRPALVKRFGEGDFDDLLRECDLLEQNERTIPRWFFRPEWRQVAAEDGQRTYPACILLFSDCVELCESLRGQFELCGTSVVEVSPGDCYREVAPDHFEIRPECAKDYEHLFSRLVTEGLRPSLILHTWTYQTNRLELTQVVELEQAQAVGAASILLVFQQLSRIAARAPEEHFEFWTVASNVQPVDLSQALAIEHAPALGVVRTMRKEAPWLHCCHLDLEARDPKSDAVEILREIASQARAHEVAFRHNCRFEARLCRVHVDKCSKTDKIRSSGVYVISGGLGGVGLQLLRFLIEKFDARVVVLGRRPWAVAQGMVQGTPEAAPWLVGLQQSVRYYSVDLAEPSAVEGALALAEAEWGPPVGVFHLAGAYAMTLLEETRPEDLMAQMRAKVLGGWVLARHARRWSECFFVSFSSALTAGGASGVGAYVAANVFLDALAYEQRRAQIEAWTISWSAWEGLGMNGNSGHKSHLARTGFESFGTEVGLVSLLASLRSEAPHLYVGLSEANGWVRHAWDTSLAVNRLLANAEHAKATPVSPIPILLDDFGVATEPIVLGSVQLHELEPNDVLVARNSLRRPSTSLERRVAAIFSELLGIERVGLDESFFDLGGDSIKIVQLRARLRQRLCIEVEFRRLFDAPTVSAIVQAHSIVTEADAPSAPLADATVRQLPLSSSQQGLWFLNRLLGPSSAYNVDLAFRIDGPINLDLLRASINVIVDRHEILRTNIEAGMGDPVQVVHARSRFEFAKVQDLSAEDPLRVTLLVQSESEYRFDITTEPLLRVSVLRTNPESFIVVFVFHHIIADGWSLGGFLAELNETYHALLEERASRLPKVTMQYGDYALWQQAEAQVQARERQLDFWLEQLAGAPRILELPTDYPRPDVLGHEGGRVPVDLGAELSSNVAVIAQRYGATVFMTLYAAFVALLHRYTSQHDIVVGSVAAQRSQIEFEPMLGFFANTLALRLQVSNQATFETLLLSAKEVALQAFAHADVPFERLVRELQPVRNLSHNPVFQVMFAFQSAPKVPWKIPGAKVQSLTSERRAATFDLVLSLESADRIISGIMEYNRSLFDESTIRRMGLHYQRLLSALLEHPDRPIVEHDFIDDEERHQILALSKNTAYEVDAAGSACDRIEWMALIASKKIAVQDEQSSITYGGLSKRSAALAAKLLALGASGKVIPIYAFRTIDTLVAMLAAWKAGAAFCPVDPGMPLERKRFIVQDLKAPLVISARFLPELAALHDNVILADDIDEADGLKAVLEMPNASDLAYVIYTSGSTGQPKGVMVTHGNLTWSLDTQAKSFAIDQASRVLNPLPLHFDAGLGQCLLGLTTGTTLFLPDAQTVSSPQALLNLMEASQCTHAAFTPTFLDAIPTARLPALKVLMVGGEACSKELVKRWAPNRSFFNVYGPTEATIATTASQCAPAGDAPNIGRPLSGVHAYVMNPARSLCPLGVVGELYIGGPTVSRGYWNSPSLTTDRFVPDPFDLTGQARLYRTGDRVRCRRDGCLEYLGRYDLQVKLRGFRIELDEVEHHLREHPLVQEAAVAVHKSPSLSEELIAYVRFKAPGDRLTLDEMRAFLSARLPEYMLPAYLEQLPSLPLTSSGKLDRSSLPCPSWEQVQIGSGSQSLPPTSALEAKLCAIWSKVLNLAMLGIRDNFFDIGGNSMLALHVSAQMYRELGLDIPLRFLFAHPTIESLAVALEHRTPHDEALLVSLQPGGNLPPLVLIHPAGGNVECYTELALGLGHRHPVFAIRASGLLPGQRSRGSIDEMANAYAQLVRDHFGATTVHLAGWSFGGLVAYEVACRLRALKQPLGVVALIDSVFSPGAAPSRVLGPDELRSAFLAEIALARNLRAENPPESSTVLTRSPTIDPVSLEELESVENELGRLYRVFRSNVLVAQRYVPTRYEGRVALFFAEATRRRLCALPPWDHYAKAPSTYQDLPGDHYSLMYGEANARLAKMLGEVLSVVDSAPCNERASGGHA